MKLSVLSLAVIFAFALYPAQAQNHQHESSTIDGNQNPELVSEADAYRHFFLTGQTQDRTILAFRAEWANRIAIYNAKATALNNAGQRADLKQFIAERDLLVQEVRKELKTTLGDRQFKATDAQVQALKRRMGVSGDRHVAVRLTGQLVPATFHPQGGGPCVTYSDSLAASWSMAMASTPSGGNGSPFSINYTVTVDGGVAMTINTKNCGLYPPNYGNIVHTPTASITAGTNKSSSSGPGVCGDCYISLQINPTFSQVIGTPVSADPGVTVACSYGGPFFTFFPTLQTEAGRVAAT